jgi:hypothetical protein
MLLFFAVESCKNNENVIATSQLQTFVHFVDSVDQFNSNYLSGTNYAEIPFEDFFPHYKKQYELIDSLDKAECFNEVQKCELQAAKKKFNHIVEGRLNTFVRFVDSVENFDAYYKTTFDTVYAEIPAAPGSSETITDTILDKHKSVFSASQNNFGSHFSSISFRNHFISVYMYQTMLMDSIGNNKCFNETQKIELQTAKKKYNKIVEEGAEN